MTNRLHYNNDSWHHYSWFGWIWPYLLWPTCQPHLFALCKDNKTTQQMKKCYLAPVVAQQVMRNVDCSMILFGINTFLCIKFWHFVFVDFLFSWPLCPFGTIVQPWVSPYVSILGFAPGFLSRALKVSWHFPLIPEHIPSFIHRLELRTLIVDYVVIY